MTLRILEVIFPIFSIVAIGLLYGKRFAPDMSVPNQLNMEVFIPALLFAVLTGQIDHVGEYFALSIAAALVIIGSGLLTWPIAKIFNIDPKTLCPPMMFSNAGNMGLPLMVLAFGEKAFPAAVVVFVVGNFLHISLGSYLLNKNPRLLQVFFSPMMIAVLLAMIVSIADITINEVVMMPIEMLSKICVPLMLFSLGVRLTDVDFSAWRLGLLSAIIGPCIGILLVLLLTPFFSLSNTQQGVLFMFSALPPAVMNFIFADHYQQEPTKVAAIVLIANACSLISIPIALVYALPKFS